MLLSKKGILNDPACHYNFDKPVDYYNLLLIKIHHAKSFVCLCNNLIEVLCLFILIEREVTLPMISRRGEKKQRNGKH